MKFILRSRCSNTLNLVKVSGISCRLLLAKKRALKVPNTPKNYMCGVNIYK